MRSCCIAPFLLLATSLSAQVQVHILSEPKPTDARAEAQIAAAQSDIYEAALSLLAGWGFPIQLAEARNGVIVTGTMALEQGGQLVHKQAGYWVDCGKDLFFSRAANAEYVNFQFIILIVGDSSTSTVEANFFASAVEADAEFDPPTCYSRQRLEPFFLDALRVRLAEAP